MWKLSTIFFLLAKSVIHQSWHFKWLVSCARPIFPLYSPLAAFYFKPKKWNETNYMVLLFSRVSTRYFIMMMAGLSSTFNPSEIHNGNFAYLDQGEPENDKELEFPLEEKWNCVMSVGFHHLKMLNYDELSELQSKFKIQFQNWQNIVSRFDSSTKKIYWIPQFLLSNPITSSSDNARTYTRTSWKFKFHWIWNIKFTLVIGFYIFFYSAYSISILPLLLYNMEQVFHRY